MQYIPRSFWPLNILKLHILASLLLSCPDILFCCGQVLVNFTYIQVLFQGRLYNYKTITENQTMTTFYVASNKSLSETNKAWHSTKAFCMQFCSISNYTSETDHHSWQCGASKIMAFVETSHGDFLFGRPGRFGMENRNRVATEKHYRCYHKTAMDLIKCVSEFWALNIILKQHSKFLLVFSRSVLDMQCKLGVLAEIKQNSTKRKPSRMDFARDSMYICIIPP